MQQETGNQIVSILRRRNEARDEIEKTQREMLHLILSQNMMDYVKIDWTKIAREFSAHER